MRLNRTLLATALGAFVPLLGCADEVGPCDDLQDGEDTVLLGGQVQFGGQAIMNTACASCHSSTAKGAARRGAPAGLDFDLLPIDPDDPALTDGTDENEKGQTYVKLKPSAVAGLRERQRRVFEDRNTIWQQVKDGMMPPPGADFDVFRTLSRIVGTSNASPCQADVGAFHPLSRKSSRDVLRKWLACRAPVVEVNSSDQVAVVPQQQSIVTTDAGSVGDGGVGAVQVAGAVGYQYPVCEGSDTGGVITVEQVFDRVFSTCGSCHPSLSVPDLSTPDKVYAELVGKQSAKCKKPYVVPGAPEQSFVYELVATETPSCSQRMPLGDRLDAAEIKLINDWIAGGALRESDVQESRISAPLQSIGLDAGVGD